MTTYTDSQLYDRLHSLYTYSDGHLVSNHTKRPITGTGAHGYLNCGVQIEGTIVRVYVHRAIFLMHHKYLPVTVDHINRIKTDNRIENLRAATQAQNSQNRSSRGNRLGARGVYLNKDAGRDKKPYTSHIMINRKLHWLGNFVSVEEASTAYQAAAKKYHGDFIPR